MISFSCGSSSQPGGREKLVEEDVVGESPGWLSESFVPEDEDVDEEMSDCDGS